MFDVRRARSRNLLLDRPTGKWLEAQLAYRDLLDTLQRMAAEAGC